MYLSFRICQKCHQPESVQWYDVMYDNDVNISYITTATTVNFERNTKYEIIILFFITYYICADVNECNNFNGGCQHKCINEIGSYKCECPTGFNLRADGLSCESM